MIARVRRIFRIRQAGHTGTLDPFATGLLVVLLGRATRLARFVERQAKTYLATARLGQATTTDDLTGEPVGEPAPVTLNETELRAALAGFLGRSSQRPPAFSAKKVAGERSYRRARRGETVDLAPVPIEVLDAAVIGWTPPEVTFRVTVSTGTYVRALARDLGARLGTGAHLTALRREAVGALRVEQAVPLDSLTADTPVLPPLAVLGHLPATELAAEQARTVRHGGAVEAAAGTSGLVALTCAGSLLAVGRVEDGRIRPVVVLEGA